MMIECLRRGRGLNELTGPGLIGRGGYIEGD